MWTIGNMFMYYLSINAIYPQTSTLFIWKFSDPGLHTQFQAFRQADDVRYVETKLNNFGLYTNLSRLLPSILFLNPLMTKVRWRIHDTGAPLIWADRPTSAWSLQMPWHFYGTRPSAIIMLTESVTTMLHEPCYIKQNTRFNCRWIKQCSKEAGRSTTHWFLCCWRVRLITAYSM